ncbi:hypothetical protein MiSe_63020 [Microseira wollei NIES-4236]|uniref:PRC-barrel domain-containing protein n=1 Tax=Microseira wollei NIES-4236 TaxID=2530354 RepID=A0AAV3XKC5_9CYAN|nr:hypothetical protein MiSe_63020 [Microseira wollei NIES-4236]
MRDELLGVVELELEDVVFLELEEALEIVGRGFTVGVGGFMGGVLELIFACPFTVVLLPNLTRLGLFNVEPIRRVEVLPLEDTARARTALRPWQVRQY